MGKKDFAGAGGNWVVRDEQPDPTVVPQAGDNHCCAACIAMLLATRGITADQHTIATNIGTPTATVDLHPELNRLDPHNDYQYDFFADLPSGLAYLQKHTPWIAFLKDFGTAVLHAVVVDGTTPHGHLLIRDPWPPGTTYTMTPADFSDDRHGWTGIAVYPKPPRPRKRKTRQPRPSPI
jgi:ABC-type bacteriocin/lantibiotic exporter with double-glycine peptidase domain